MRLSGVHADKALERGDQIETLVDRTSNLEAHATVFKKQATVLERKLWWKNAWLWILVVILLGLVRPSPLLLHRLPRL